MPPPGSPLGPVPQAISGLSLSVTLNEITLLVGQNRTVLDSQNTPTGFQRVEWSAAYSMAPSTAVTLRDTLIKSVAQYEASFGKIPVDPNAKIQLAGLNAPK
jgi:hypothetical protein